MKQKPDIYHQNYLAAVEAQRRRELNRELMHYDMIQIRQRELELFEASPAFAKYQEGRHARHWLKTGDWRQP